MSRQFVWGWALSLGLLGAGQSAVRNNRDAEGDRGPESFCSKDLEERGEPARDAERAGQKSEA